MPQQGSTNHCAAYTVWFALERICGRNPAGRERVFTGNSVMKFRKAMAFRIVKELPIEDDRKAEDDGEDPADAPAGRDVAEAPEIMPETDDIDRMNGAVAKQGVTEWVCESGEGKHRLLTYFARHTADNVCARGKVESYYKRLLTIRAR